MILTDKMDTQTMVEGMENDEIRSSIKAHIENKEYIIAIDILRGILYSSIERLKIEVDTIDLIQDYLNKNTSFESEEENEQTES